MTKRKVPGLDPSAATPPSPPGPLGGIEVKDMAPGEKFAFDGRLFQLTRCDGKVAQVMLMEEVSVQKAPGKYVKQEQGKARFEMRGDLLVKRR